MWLTHTLWKNHDHGHTVSLTQAFRQQIANKFIVVSHVEDAVDTRGHQLLLGVSEVARHVLGHEDDAAFPVDDKEETIEGLVGQREEQKDPVRPSCVELEWKVKRVAVCVLLTSSSMGPRASFSTSPWLLEEMSLFCTSSSGERRAAFSVQRRQNHQESDDTDARLCDT